MATKAELEQRIKELEIKLLLTENVYEKMILNAVAKIENQIEDGLELRQYDHIFSKIKGE